MALNVPVFFTRLGSSIVFVAIMAVGLFWNEWSFLVMVALINVLCLREYFKLIKKIDSETYWPKWLPLVIIIFSSQIFVTLILGIAMHKFTLVRLYSYIFSGLFIVGFAVLFIISVVSKKTSLQALFQSIGGLLYITLPMVLLYLMREHGKLWPIALIFMIWSNDTMAYLVGSFFGKTPFSSISPKKTWEGTGGGAVLTMIAAALYGYFTRQYSVVDGIALGLCATVAGTLGDLVESKLKRMADVKDSGTMMPGHGGALDRFDSLLIAAPFAAVYILIFTHSGAA